MWGMQSSYSRILCTRYASILNEFKGDVQETTVGELLPGAFTTEDMDYAAK